MILRVTVVGVLLVTAAVVQTSLFPFVPLGGFRPDVLLLIVLAVAIRDGALPGLRVGFAAGLLSDLLASQAPVGLAALVYTAIGYAIGVARPYLAPSSVTAPLLLAFGSGFVGTAGYGILTLLLSDQRVAVTLLLHSALAVALFNTLLAPVVIGAVRWLTERFPLRGPALME